jgi:hypothetical protein
MIEGGLRRSVADLDRMEFADNRSVLERPTKWGPDVFDFSVWVFFRRGRDSLIATMEFV